MDMEIGEAAGRIWQYLVEHGETTVRQLQHETALSECLLHLGAGWLAREDKLCVRQERGILKLACKTVSTSMIERRTPPPRTRETTIPLRGMDALGGRAREAFL